MNFINTVVKSVRGIVKLRGNTDNTVIGNKNDRLKTNNLSKDGLLALIAASKWMDQAVIDSVTESITSDVSTLTFKEGDCTLGIATIDLSSEDARTLSLERYFCNDDGVPLEDDDSTKLNLE